VIASCLCLLPSLSRWLLRWPERLPVLEVHGI
jgi:hypothetical protein